MYKPIRWNILRNEANKFEEDSFTLQYMEEYGIEFVRGGSWTNPRLSQKQKEEIRHRINSANGACFRCGIEGHLAAYCKLKPDERLITLDEYIGPPKRPIPRKLMPKSVQADSVSQAFIVQD